MLKARKTVASIPEYHPPLGSRQGMRLDFNENTVGCSPRGAQKLGLVTAQMLSRYPERGSVETQVAQFLGRKPEEVLLTNGVDEAIHLLCETYLEAGDEVLLVVPTYAMYEIYARATGATIVKLPAGENFAYPVEKVLQSITARTRLIMIANPNNPTGTAVAAADLLRIANTAPDAAVLVDEAYFEFHGNTLMPQVGAIPNLFVTRTFSKVYGLAGLRIGILAGAAEQMSMVRRVGSPYSVNGAALACLPEALADTEYVSNYVSEALESRARIEQEFAKLDIQYWPSQANFVLAYFGDLRVPFVKAMRERGILVRDRNNDPGCTGCVRITAGTRQQTDALLSALCEAIAELRNEVAR